MSDPVELNTSPLNQAIKYWIAHWDQECPTLFGLDLNELKDSLENLQSGLATEDSQVILACIGSLRELLHGGSAVPESEVENLLGISYSQANDLLHYLSNRYRDAL